VDDALVLDAQFQRLVLLAGREPAARGVVFTKTPLVLRWAGEPDASWLIEGLPLDVLNASQREAKLRFAAPLSFAEICVPAWSRCIARVPWMSYLIGTINLQVMPGRSKISLELPDLHPLKGRILPFQLRPCFFVNGGRLRLDLPTVSTLKRAMNGRVEITIDPESEGPLQAYTTRFEPGYGRLCLDEVFDAALEPGPHRARLAWQDKLGAVEVPAIAVVSESAGRVIVDERETRLLFEHAPEPRLEVAFALRQLGGRRNRLAVQPESQALVDLSEVELPSLDPLETEIRLVRLPLNFDDSLGLLAEYSGNLELALEHVDDDECGTALLLRTNAPWLDIHRHRVGTAPLLGPAIVDVELPGTDLGEVPEMADGDRRFKPGNPSWLRLRSERLCADGDSLVWLVDAEAGRLHAFLLSVDAWDGPLPVTVVADKDRLKLRFEAPEGLRIRPEWRVVWRQPKAPLVIGPELPLPPGLLAAMRHISCLVDWGGRSWRLDCRVHVPGRLTRARLTILKQALRSLEEEDA
jgi:hypothetical protein